MQNNPLMTLMQAARSGKNPTMLLRQMAMRNPQIAQFMQMIDGKSTAELRAMAENMAKERGTSIEEVARQLGLK